MGFDCIRRTITFQAVVMLMVSCMLYHTWLLLLTSVSLWKVCRLQFWFDSLPHGRHYCNQQYVISEFLSLIYWRIFCHITKWLVTCRHLSQCLRSSMTPHGVTRSQGVNGTCSGDGHAMSITAITLCYQKSKGYIYGLTRHCKTCDISGFKHKLLIVWIDRSVLYEKCYQMVFENSSNFGSAVAFRQLVLINYYRNGTDSHNVGNKCLQLNLWFTTY